jgi:hypothetical protein
VERDLHHVRLAGEGDAVERVDVLESLDDGRCVREMSLDPRREDEGVVRTRRVGEAQGFQGSRFSARRKATACAASAASLIRHAGPVSILDEIADAPHFEKRYVMERAHVCGGGAFHRLAQRGEPLIEGVASARTPVTCESVRNGPVRATSDPPIADARATRSSSNGK